MDSLTQGVTQSPYYGIIDIIDVDHVKYNEILKVKKISGSRMYRNLTISQRSFENNLQKTNLEFIDEHTDEFRVHSSNITSDDEDSYDDNAPISTLKTQHNSRIMTDSEVEDVKNNVSSLKRLRKPESDNKQDKSSSDLNKTVVSKDDKEDNGCVNESNCNLQKTNPEYVEEEHMDVFRVHSSYSRSAIRKRAAKIIISDDEGSYDDNAPICTIKTQRSLRVMRDLEEEVKENASRRYPTRLRKLDSDIKQENSSSDTNKNVVSSDYEEDDDGLDESESKLQKTYHEYIDEEYTDEFRVHLSNSTSAKRKWASNIVSSDDEDNDDDDNALICTLKTQDGSRVMTDSEDEVKEIVSRRYPTRLRKSEYDSKQEKSSTENNKTLVSSEDEEDNDRVDETESNLQKTIDEEQTDEFKVRSSYTRSAKRKQASNVVTSENEVSDDDNAPISTLITQHSSRVVTDSEEEVNETVSWGQLRRLRKTESDNKQDKSSFDSNKMFVSSEDEEDIDAVYELQSEGENSDGFIVSSPESVSNCDTKISDSIHESEDELNEYYDYKATMKKIGRKKHMKMKWDLEGDMLSDFGKDPRLCMSAVCVLYRQQTADEKESKETRYRNQRGFSQPDAPRGCKLGEFLTDGDSGGDLNKTVEELEDYDSEGIERCRDLATKYSKQLFEIYQNKEDPHFRTK